HSSGEAGGAGGDKEGDRGGAQVWDHFEHPGFSAGGAGCGRGDAEGTGRGLRGFSERRIADWSPAGEEGDGRGWLDDHGGRNRGLGGDEREDGRDDDGLS